MNGGIRKQEPLAPSRIPGTRTRRLRVTGDSSAAPAVAVACNVGAIGTFLSTNASTMRYLLYFANELLEFRWPEVEGIISKFCLSVKPTVKSSIPYAVVSSSCEEDVVKLCSRSVLLISAFELWAEGTTRKELFDNIKSSKFINDERFTSQKRSFKIQVDTFNKKMTLANKINKIEEMAFLPFKGPVDLTSPDNVFRLIEFYGMDPNNSPPEPFQLYFGRWICDSGRHLLYQFSLQERKFISNTSMDPTLSFVMANIGRVDEGDFVFDPFVGSGSIIVSAAKFGALVAGSDIDYKLLHGLSKPTKHGVKERQPDENVFNNLKQYGLESRYIDVFLCDASKPMLRSGLKFDSILCDPPYGIRESSEKVGSLKKKHQESEGDTNKVHFPAKVQYHQEEVVHDLLNFAAEFLTLRGRLVFWYPVIRDKGQRINFCEPQHDCLEKLNEAEQPLSGSTSRILFCFEKVKEPGNAIIVNTSNGEQLRKGPTFRELYFSNKNTNT